MCRSAASRGDGLGPLPAEVLPQLPPTSGAGNSSQSRFFGAQFVDEHASQSRRKPCTDRVARRNRTSALGRTWLQRKQG